MPMTQNNNNNNSFFLGPKASLVMGSWSSLQFQVWVPFCWVGLNSIRKWLVVPIAFMPRLQWCVYLTMLAVIMVHRVHSWQDCWWLFYIRQSIQLARRKLLCWYQRDFSVMWPVSSAIVYWQILMDNQWLTHFFLVSVFFWGILLFVYSGSLVP